MGKRGGKWGERGAKDIGKIRGGGMWILGGNGGKIWEKIIVHFPPFSPILAPPITQFTHPLCPISPENHHFPHLGGWFITIFPLVFQK